MPLAQARRLHTEVGKIRIGDRQPIESGKNKGDPRPNKLTKFRLTGNNLHVLEAASKVYGGTVTEWVVPREWQGKGTPPEHRYQLYTTSDLLRVVIRGSSMLDTTRECWDGGWCVRRCDGAHIFFDAWDKSMVGRPCQCPDDPDLRKKLAAKGEACNEVSRLLMQIYDLPSGYWRMDTKGFFGPAELRELQDYLQILQLGARPVEAMLRLEIRRTRRIADAETRAAKHLEGKAARQTLEYPVVVLEPIYTAAQLALTAGGRHGPIALLSEAEQAAEAADVLYGEGAGDVFRALASPPQEGVTAMDFAPEIEAAIMAQPGGEVEAWYQWAERRFRKDRAQFTTEDWQRFLQSVRDTAARFTSEQAHPQPPQGDTRAAVPPEDLWQREEREAHANGEE